MCVWWTRFGLGFVLLRDLDLIRFRENTVASRVRCISLHVVSVVEYTTSSENEHGLIFLPVIALQLEMVISMKPTHPLTHSLFDGNREQQRKPTNLTTTMMTTMTMSNNNNNSSSSSNNDNIRAADALKCKVRPLVLQFDNETTVRTTHLYMHTYIYPHIHTY